MSLTSRTISRFLLLLLLSAVYVLLYGETWLDMERVWRSSATYNHCYLILPISLYFFYQQKYTANSTATSPHWLWLPVIALMLLQLLWLFSYAADIALFMHIAAVMTLQAIIWLILGNARSRSQLFAIAYLLFLIPFGEELSPFLQNITADLTVVMLHIVNVPVYREGLYLSTPVGLFEVAEACSGLRFLIASLAISVLFAHLHYTRLWKKICFVAFMAALSVLANGVRAFMLVYIGEKTDMQFGFGADHYLYGWLFFGLVLVAGFWLGARFSDPLVPQTANKPEQNNDNTTADAVLSGKPIALMSILLALALMLSFRLSLQVAVPPTIAAPLNLSFANQPANDSLWGISFADSLAQVHVQDANGTEYFIANYANKQQRGKLISWNNTLFDKQRWQVQRRVVAAEHVILQLKSLSDQNRTVMYWYQVDDKRAVSELKTKLQQAISYLSDDTSVSAVYAVSLSGDMSEDNLQLLHQAAAAFAHYPPGKPPLPEITYD